MKPAQAAGSDSKSGMSLGNTDLSDNNQYSFNITKFSLDLQNNTRER